VTLIKLVSPTLSSAGGDGKDSSGGKIYQVEAVLLPPAATQ
jgi:hypothetical protein